MDQSIRSELYDFKYEPNESILRNLYFFGTQFVGKADSDSFIIDGWPEGLHFYIPSLL